MRLSLSATLFAVALSTGALACRDVSPAPEAAAPARSPLAHAWDSRETRVYDLTLDLHASLDGEATRRALLPANPDDPTAAPRIEQHIAVSGRLEDTLVAVSGPSITTHVRLTDVRAIALPDGANPDALRATLARGAIALRHRDGRIEQVRLPEGADPIAAAILNELLVLTQVSLPEAARHELSWSGDEASSQGAWRGRYRRQGDDGLIKSIEAFSPHGPSLSDERVLAAEGRVEGSLALRVDGGGRLTSAHGELTGMTVLSAAPATPYLTTRSRVELELRERRASREIRFDDFAAARPVAEAAAPIERKDNLDLAALVGGASFAELVAGARAAAGDARAREQATGRLAAYLRLHPEAADDLARELLPMDSDAVSASLVGALQSAAHPEAQAALGRVLLAWRRGDEDRCRGLVMSIGSLREATPETVELVLAQSRRRDQEPLCASTAELSLGRLARRLGKSAPGRAAAIVVGLRAELAASGTPSRTSLILSALGNSGAPEILPDAVRYLADADPDVRGSALMALRWLPGAAVDAHLAERLAGEQDQDVLNTLVGVLSGRPLNPALAMVLARRVREPLRRTLRFGMISLLARARQLDVSVDEALAGLRSDADAEVAARARALITG